MQCSEVLNLLSAYYDNELAAELQAKVDTHVGSCKECDAELAAFGKLSCMTERLEKPQTPASVWSAVEQNLELNHLDKVVASASASSKDSRRRFIQFAAAIAATLVIVFVGWTVWPGDDHDHEKMAEAMEYVASNTETDGITTHLLNKYGGSEVSATDAITLVGYQPIASKGLPPGYTVEGIQVLNMPCCKCTQTACKRPDNSRFFIYEHDNEETGWFEHQNKRQSECCGKTCEIVELDNRLAVTWQKGNRHITLLGVRDEDEIELLVSQFEEKS